MAQKKSSLLLSWLNSAKRKLSPNRQAQILQKQIKPGFSMTYLEPSQCPGEMKKNWIKLGSHQDRSQHLYKLKNKL